MKCLQCSKAATVEGMFKGIEIRVCEAGHRTAEASPAMIKQSEAWKKTSKKVKKSGIVDYAPAEIAA